MKIDKFKNFENKNEPYNEDKLGRPEPGEKFKYEIVEQIAEEDEEPDDEYYILYFYNHATSPFDYFYLHRAVGLMQTRLLADNDRFTEIFYEIDGHEYHNTFYGYVCDRREDFDLERMKAIFRNINRQAKKCLGACINKNVMTKEEFINISDEIYEEAVEQLMPVLEQKINRIVNQMDDLRNGERYFKSSIED